MAIRSKTRGRLFSSKILEFTVPTLALPGTHNHKGGLNLGKGNVLTARYVALLRMSIKAAMREFDWELDKDNTFYLAITIYIGKNDALTNRDKEYAKRVRKGDVLPIRYPRLDKYTEYVVKALTGVAIDKAIQIQAITIIKKFDLDQECMEILLGRCDKWGELNHDIRNA